MMANKLILKTFQNQREIMNVDKLPNIKLCSEKGFLVQRLKVKDKSNHFDPLVCSIAF